MNLSSFWPNARNVLGLGLAALVLLPGCVKKTTEERAVDSAAKRYGRITVGMAKQDVIASLGSPLSRQASIYHWETVAGPENLVSINVHFDRADKVSSTAKTRVDRN